jgi:beta-xylosidase
MSYSFDGSDWVPVDYELQMRYTLDYFTGYRSALYNYATKELGGVADFDYFRQEEI